MRVAERIARAVVGLEARILRAGVVRPWQLVQKVSLIVSLRARVCGPVTLVHGSKWPISYSVSSMYGPAPHGMRFCAAALEYSGSKLKAVPEQSTGLVVMNPFAAEAIMKPDWWVVDVVLAGFECVPTSGEPGVEHVHDDRVARVHHAACARWG